MLGQPYTLACNVEVVEGLVVQPIVQWLNSTSNEPLAGNGITVGALQIFGSTTSLTLTFDSLSVSDLREYICQGCVSIQKVFIQNHCASTRLCITLERKCANNET